MPTSLVRISADQSTAQQLSVIAEARLPVDEVSIAVFESAPDDEVWRLEIYAGPNIASNSLADMVRAAMGDEIAGFDLVAEELDDADWVANAIAGLEPVPAGRFLVHGAHDAQAVPVNVYGIQVEAALAFGTGHHGTTKGCLIAFDRLLNEIRPRKVLDLGTGTGVLAIAAAKALRQKVTASDIDPISVRIAKENAALNKVANRVRVVEANGLQHPVIATGGPYDLIFANILAGPLMRLAPGIRRVTEPGAAIILSGLLTHQERMVRAAYRAQGFVPVRHLILGNWVTLTLVAGR